MLFNSAQYLIFLPLVLLVYYVIPNRLRYLWLLAASYYFYMCWNAKYALLMLFSTFTTYLCSLGIERIKSAGYADEKSARLKKYCVAASFIINLAILFFFKYFNFAWDSHARLLSLAGVLPRRAGFDVILPVGISFYTFQALGYTIDVYRGDIYAEKNFFRYALFVSFFPQLVAGPIERSKNLLKQLAVPQKLKFANFRDGLLLMLWGYFLKLVLADRLGIYVDAVYGSWQEYVYSGGWYLITATVFFAFQIYCDFCGYTMIATGSARLLGIELMRNFDAPYLSASVAEFWRRWHISLSSWFRDYLYIPLGGNRRGKKRKYLNLLITFSVSGLWHGANWTFVAWGLINGIYQVIGDFLRPVREFAVRTLGLDRGTLSHRLVKTAATFVLIDLSWVFFRADSLWAAVQIVRGMLHAGDLWIFFDGTLAQGTGLGIQDMTLLAVCLCVLFVSDLLRYKNVVVHEVIARQDWWFQIAVIVFSFLFIMLFGVWGSGYDAASFIYFQF